MSYHVYTTDAVVLEARARGESGRYFTLLTRELGVIGASAEGVRDLKSKLRYVLQEYRYVKVSVVRGKETWRVVSAAPASSLPQPTAIEHARLLSLVGRLSPGERRDPELFYFLTEVASCLAGLSPKERRLLEILAGVHISAAFGYGPNDSDLLQFVDMLPLTPEILTLFAPFARRGQTHISNAIAASHL